MGVGRTRGGAGVPRGGAGMGKRWEKREGKDGGECLEVGVA